MFATVLLSILASAPIAPAMTVSQDPAIRITLNNDRQFVRGEQGKVKIRTDDDGFLLVLHADPDGRIRVLFPLDPTDDNFVRGRHTYELRDRGDRESFTVEAGSGQGAIYAAVSRDPFQFAAFSVNNHWDYNALNTQDPGNDPEPVLGDLVQQMAGGPYDYDYLTYDVYESAYSSVSYASPAVVYTPSYGYASSYYCDPFYDYYCDSYYYSPSRFSVAINFGSPFYSRPYYYDPFYYGYSPYYYRPSRYYAYPSYPYYYNTPGGGSTYRPRYTTPSEFKQTDRTWGGVPYRDRLGATPVTSVNTVYDPAPVRRGTTQGDMGRAPAVSSPSTSSASPRRRVEATPARVDRPNIERAAPERRQASPARTEPGQPRAEPRQSTPPTRETAPTRRRDESRSQGTPELQRRNGPVAAPMIERAAPERRGDVVGRPVPRMSEPTPRSEPMRRVERPEPQARSAPRPEPAARSAPPARSYSPPPASAPRSEPSRPSNSGGGGGGGRRGPR
jgi:hypothetical protein